MEDRSFPRRVIGRSDVDVPKKHIVFVWNSSDTEQGNFRVLELIVVSG